MPIPQRQTNVALKFLRMQLESLTMSKGRTRKRSSIKNITPQEFIQLDHDYLKLISTEELIHPLRVYPDQIAIRFASGIAGHYLSFNTRTGNFVVVHGGTFGPENRPAKIDMRNLRILHEECDDIQSVPISDTPFNAVEINTI